MDVQEISRRLAEDSAEVTRSLEMFMNERTSALRAQERAMEIYDAEMAEIGEGSVASSVEDPVDHNLMRHLNATRVAAISDDYDEFEAARAELEYSLNAEKRGPKKDKIDFDKGLEPKPEMPDPVAKASMRDEMFNFLDNTRMEEMKLELEYEKLKEEIGLARSDFKADELLAVQKSNYGKLMDMFKKYQPQSFGKAWGNDPDYSRIAGDLDALIRRIDRESSEHLFDESGTLLGGEEDKKKKKKKKANRASTH